MKSERRESFSTLRRPTISLSEVARPLRALLAALYVLSTPGAFAQETSSAQPTATAQPADKVDNLNPDAKPKKQDTTLRSAAMTAGGDSAAGSIGGIRTPEGVKVSSGGAATQSIPIAVPPGIVKPNLSFNFNSQGENSLLGVGWSVGGLPVIHRCPRTIAQDSFKGAINYDSGDRFCLDGQRLMVISGTYGADSSEYRTEVDSFLKVTAKTLTGINGPAYFIVKTKEGQTMEFGGNTGSAQGRIEPQGRTDVVRVWALSKISDVKGNYLTVAYDEDTSNGEYRPIQVDYTGNTAGGLTPNRKVTFEYISRTDLMPLYVGGSKILTTKLLSFVKTYVGAQLVRDYRLEYENGAATKRSRLKRIKECDAVGNCLPTTTQPAWQLTWQEGGTGFNQTSRTSDLYNNDPRYNYVGDFNGDGKADIVSRKTNSTVVVHLSTPTGYSNVTWASDLNVNNPAWNWVGDFNGDGRADIVSRQNSTTLKLHLSRPTGDGFDITYPTVSISMGTGDPDFYWIGDFDGDGRADIMMRNPSSGGASATIYFANATGGFDAISYTTDLNNVNAFWNWVGDFNGDGKTDIASRVNTTTVRLHLFVDRTTGFSLQTWGADVNQTNHIWYFVGDFNGDGKSDILLKNEGSGGNASTINFSTGAGFSAAPVTTDLNNNDSTWNRIGDFNGDGKMDIGSRLNSTTLRIHLSTGTGFDIQSWTATVDTGTTGHHYLADFDGDGKTDWFQRSASSGGSVMDANSVNTPYPDLLTHIINPFSGQTAITYKPLTDNSVYTKDTGGQAASYPNFDLQLPTYVVSNLTVSDGLGTNFPFDYTYGGAKAHHLGRGGLGFRWMATVDASANVQSRTTVYFNQFNPNDVNKPFPLTGTVDKSETEQTNGVAFALSANFYSVTDHAQSATVKILKHTRVENDECSGLATDPDCQTFRRTAKSMEYDANGNPTRTLHEGNVSITGDERDEITEWIVDTTNWIHRPKRQLLFDGNSQSGAPIIREKWLYYDGLPYGQMTAGLLTKEELNGGDPQGSGNNNPVTGKNPVTTYSPDPNFGVITSVRDPRGCETVIAFETTKTFPQTITNCLNHVKTLSFDPGLGVKLSETDPNNATTQFRYDGFGRMTKNWGPLDSESVPLVSYEYLGWGTLDGTLNSQRVKTSRREQHLQAGTLDSWEFFDGLGRVDFTRQEGPDSTKFIVTDTVHNSRNLVVQRSAPYFVDIDNNPLEAIKNITFTYDVLGRLKRTTNADGFYSENVYKVPGIVEITDERGKMRRKYFDAHGRLVKVEEFNSGQTYTTTYAYNGAGSLLTVVNHLGHTTRMAYDLLGRKEAMCDPNMGTAWGVTNCTTGSVGAWVYTYSSAGDLKTQKDAKNQTICFDYDLLGRPTVKKQGATCTGTTLATFTYDDPLVLNSKGRLTQVVDTATTTKFAYDIMGRTTETQRLVLGAWRTMAQIYNALNQVRTETFPAPDNEVVTYNYNTAGWVQAVTATSGPNYINNINYNARGQKTQITYGNNLVTDFTFDLNRFWVTNRVTSGNQQNLTYTRDPIGNILTITDATSSTGSRTFTYDDLSRLATASGNFGPNQSPQSCTYEYNAIGDITNKCGAIFSYGDSMHPSAVTYNPATGKSYTYDANGNMLTRGNQTLNWDIDNRVASISITGGGTTYMEYDYTGMRFKKDSLAGIAFFPFQGYEIDPNGVITKFIKIGVETFASNRGGSKLYYHNDHLGSVHVITSEIGTQAQLNEYDPWGGVSKSVGNIDPTHRFNGKELDPETGLYYYGGRYYDPEISRFVSPDPFVPQPGNPQSLNRYSYTLNNPQNYIDPSGFSWFSDLFKSIGNFFKRIAGTIVGIAVSVVTWGVGAPAVVAGIIGGGVAGAVNTGINGGNPFRNIFGGAALGGLAAGVAEPIFAGLGGSPTAGALTNFAATVGTGSIVGGITGAVSTGIFGGNFGRNVVFGILGGASTGAAMFGLNSAFEYLAELQISSLKGQNITGNSLIKKGFDLLEQFTNKTFAGTEVFAADLPNNNLGLVAGKNTMLVNKNLLALAESGNSEAQQYLMNTIGHEGTHIIQNRSDVFAALKYTASRIFGYENSRFEIEAFRAGNLFQGFATGIKGTLP